MLGHMKDNGWMHDMVQTVRMLMRNVRKFRLSRDFLTFLIFLFVSILLWGFISLRETRSVPVDYKLVIKGLPEKVIFTSDVPSSVTLYIRGRGFSFFEYYLQKGTERSIEIDYRTLEKTTGHFVLDMKVWRSALEKELTAGLELDNSSPLVLDVFFSLGYHNRYPVRFNGTVKAGAQYLITEQYFYPDSVEVYAPLAMHDTLKAVYISDTVFSGLDRSVECNLPLAVSRGAKCIPDSVRFVAKVDMFTEKRLEVPIYCENIPHNKVLRTFPSRATVKFHVSMALFDSIAAEDFLVVVDYNRVASGTQRLPLAISQVPRGVSHVSVQPDDVEFVVEQMRE